MPTTPFPFRLFVILLCLSSGATFFTANSLSVKKYLNPEDMIIPFPVVMETNGTLQVVTRAQQQQLQLPDPQTGLRMQLRYLLPTSVFDQGIMEPRSIKGDAITNNGTIIIPTNYTAQVSGKIVDETTQNLTIIYNQAADEDQIITAIYTAKADQYTPVTQYVKNSLIWKTIFMNGMMASLILSFVICKWRMKKNAPQPVTP